MIEVSGGVIEALTRNTWRELLGRTDRWLARVQPAWSAMPEEARRDQLRLMMQRGEACGMESEADVALFAWLCVARGRDWAEWTHAVDVHGVFEDRSFTPQAKLMALEADLREGLPA